MKRSAIFLAAVVSAGLAQRTPVPHADPTPEQKREIQSKAGQIDSIVGDLKARHTNEELVADVEVYAKAGHWLLEFPEDFFTPDDIDHALSVLDTGLERARQLQKGQSPWLASRRRTHGFYSSLDGSVQPYGVTIPESYDGTRPVRLYVWLHGRAARLTEASFLYSFPNQGPSKPPVADADQIQLDVYGRWNGAGYHFAGETDVFEAIAAVEKRYKIDPKRILLRGFSMGGEGAWHIALHYPDRWAAAEIGAGTWSRRPQMPGLTPYQSAALRIWENMPEWALNIFNLPLAGHDGDHDTQVSSLPPPAPGTPSRGQLESSLKAREQLVTEGFQFEGEPDNLRAKSAPAIFLISQDTGHGTSPLVRERLDAFLKEYGDRGQVSPDHIRFLTYTTRYNKDYWVTVEALDQHYERAEVDAQRSSGGRQYQIATKNVARLALTETDHAAALNIDGQDLRVRPAAHIAIEKTALGWRVARSPAPPGLHKTHALQGPIDDAFLDPFLLVRPTGTPWNDAVNQQTLRLLARFDRLYAKWFRAHPRIKDDSEVVAADFAKYNVVLFGDPGSNRWIARMIAKTSGKLPVGWTRDMVTLGEQKFPAAEHFPALVYPNPLNPSRYVVLNSGLTIDEREYRGDYGMPRLGDYAVLKVNAGADVPDVDTAGLFDESWQLPKLPPQKTVTVTEGTNIAATVSPDQRTIIVDLQGGLWSIPFQGGTGKQLTDPLLEPARPDYSPKGDLVAFQAYSGGTFHIWTMKPDGTGLRQLTSGHGDDREPRWAPDGARIAFSSDRAFKGSYDIWVADVTSGKLTPWTSAPADEYEPAWSPDGSEIAFVSGTGAAGTTIQAVNAAGAVRTLETAPARAHLNSPSWSPDGKKIAYTQFLNNKSVLMIAGTQAATYDDVFPFPATWLDGNRLLFTANGKIRVANANGSGTQDIPFEAQFTLNRPPYRHKRFDLDSDAARPVKGIVSPALSPDGKRVLFEALNQLWVMEIGGKPRQLTNDKYYKEDPTWSPDGKKIAYSSDKAGTEDIYVLDLATKEEKRVTSLDDSAEVSAAWSPDGKMLAYQDQNGATFALDLDTGKTRRVAAPLFAPSKPSWSANGKTIAIGALKPYTRRYREGTSQILTVDVASGAVRYSEPAPFKSLSTRGEDGPIYAPDGSTLAFVMDSVLWIQPVDHDGVPAGPARQINHEVTDAPTWSGDSKKLLYLSNAKLRLISVDGSNPVTVPLDMTWRYEKAEQTIIHAGRLWDGRGAEVRTDVDITVVNGRVQSIEPHRARGTHSIDASKLTVIPGLWESHTHEWISGKFYGDRLGRLWLAYGVTELQSQGDPVYRAVETREAFGSGDRVGPRYFASGEAIDGERVYYNFMRPTMSDAQLDLELDRARALDYDLLKTYVRLPHAMQEKAMKYAHEKMGVVAASHYMLPGVAYGMDAMTHVSATARLGFAYTRSAGGVSYRDMRTLFSTSGMFDISTPFTSFPLYAEDPKMVDDERLLKLNTPWDEAVLRAKRDLAQGNKPDGLPAGLRAALDPATGLDSLKKEEETVASILRAGGVVLAGTDSPLDNVATALHLNLRAQVKFGLEPWRALQTATLLPARAFGVSQDLGTIEPGKIADLVLVSGDPLHEIKDVANVQFVMKSGKLYSIAELMAPFAH